MQGRALKKKQHRKGRGTAHWLALEKHFFTLRVKWLQQQRHIRIRGVLHAARTMKTMWAKPRPCESIWIL